MSRKEIRELLELKGWTQAELARRLEIRDSAVCRWLQGTTKCLGPARILMRQWLDEARRNPREPAAAAS